MGADGAASPVREQLRIPRVGGPYSEKFLIADVLLSGYTFDLACRRAVGGLGAVVGRRRLAAAAAVQQ